MDEEEFKKIMIDNLKNYKIKLSDLQLEQFYTYMNTLIESNKLMNLTAITEPNEIIKKHFIDSLTVINQIDKNSNIIDIGTGAGFPGIPIKIAYPNIRMTLLDSLNKRIDFLNMVIEKLKLKNVKTIHGRAEDYGRNLEYREKYDIVIARAVAPLNILLEYLMPYVKLNGICICMKGSNADQEIANSKNAIRNLGGKLINTEEFTLYDTDIKRKIIKIVKIEKTDNKYPRKAGVPSKKPL